MIRILATIKKI